MSTSSAISPPAAQPAGVRPPSATARAPAVPSHAPEPKIKVHRIIKYESDRVPGFDRDAMVA